MLRFALTVILVLVVGESFAQVVHQNGCTAVNTTKDFDVEKFEGNYYVYQQMFYLLAYCGKCGTKNYTLYENGTVDVRMAHISTINDKKVTITGLASMDPTDNSKMKVHVNELPLLDETDEWVLETDYETFSIIYACYVIDDTDRSATLAWVITREQFPTNETKEAISAVFEKYDIDTTYLFDVDQTNCTNWIET